MDITFAKAWMAANLAKEMRRFGLSHWRIDVEYRNLDGGRGMMIVDRARERATLAIDLYDIPDEAMLLETVRHELCHAVASTFVILGDLIQELAPESAKEAFNKVYHDLWETMVRNLERMSIGHLEKP